MELRLPLEMSPGRGAACRAVFGTWGFFRTMHGQSGSSSCVLPPTSPRHSANPSLGNSENNKLSFHQQSSLAFPRPNQQGASSDFSIPGLCSPWPADLLTRKVQLQNEKGEVEGRSPGSVCKLLKRILALADGAAPSNETIPCAARGP